MNDKIDEESDIKYEGKDTVLEATGKGWARFQNKCYNCRNTIHQVQEIPEKNNK